MSADVIVGTGMVLAALFYFAYQGIAYVAREVNALERERAEARVERAMRDVPGLIDWTEWEREVSR